MTLESEHRHVAGDRRHVGDGELRGGVEVGLRQHDHRPRAALPGEDEVALEPAQVEVLVHRGDEESDVDVRREHLLLGRLPGGLARELRVPRQDGGDRAGLLLQVGHDDDPVAHDREIGGARRFVDEAASDLAAKLTVLGEHVVGAAVLDRDPAGDGVAVGEGLVQGAQPVVPAERFELRQADTPFRPRVHESGARGCAPVGEARQGARGGCWCWVRASRRTARRAWRRKQWHSSSRPPSSGTHAVWLTARLLSGEPRASA